MTTPASPSKCVFCGAPLPADAKFCGACGQSISVIAPAPMAVPNPPPTPPADAAPTIPPPAPLNATAPCPNCGQSISVDYERCPFCGGNTKLSAPAPVAPAATPAAPPTPAYIPPPRSAAPAPAAPAEKKKLSTGCIIGIIIAAVLFCIGLCVGAYILYEALGSSDYSQLLPWLAQLL
ncbi:MAG TPA: zinc ribbon domain-containing protein [Anaerolineaceae bacterium]|nr:zinc ribbon domain-containing protein [Anaerolineaceae bacterium]